MDSMTFVAMLARLFVEAMTLGGMSCAVEIDHPVPQEVVAWVSCQDDMSYWTETMILDNGTMISLTGWSA